MIDWKACGDSMPEDNQECILYSDEADKVVGPIIYKSSIGGWIDLFATQEAGHVFKPGENGPTHWALWNEPTEPMAYRDPPLAEYVASAGYEVGPDEIKK